MKSKAPPQAANEPLRNLTQSESGEEENKTSDSACMKVSE